jgi:hypothetical protein
MDDGRSFLFRDVEAIVFESDRFDSLAVSTFCCNRQVFDVNTIERSGIHCVKHLKGNFAFDTAARVE